ncbi:MAG: hypothetical protein ACTJGD_03695 [Mesonia hippocampi]|uniref:hypothetical protein n=1 Tax=Mesonia hippocampi TaxID=1628250 RepID=UPI003F9A66D6
MKKITYLLFFVLSFSVYAQPSYIYTFKSADSITRYIEQNKLMFQPEDVYITKDFESFKAYSETKYYQTPRIYIFNSEGDFLETITNVNAERKLSNFKRIKKKPARNESNLDFWTQKLIHYKSENLYKDTHTYTYTFVINWYLLDTEQKPIVLKLWKEWYDVLLRQKAAGEDIQIILLNIDAQDYWELSPTWREYVLENLNRNEIKQ